MLLTRGLNASVKKYPNRFAVIEEKFQLTYKALYQRIDQLASGLWHMGLRKGNRIGIIMDNDYRFIEIKYASLMIGAIFVPISTRYSLPEMEYILNDFQPNVLFVGQKYIAMISEVRKFAEIEKYILVSDENEPHSEGFVNYNHLLNGQIEREEVEVHEDDIAGIYYTGGTTGKAKGVMLSHRNIFSSILHYLAHNHNSYDDIHLQVGPMFHLGGSVAAFMVITVGAAICFLNKFEPMAVFEKIEKFKVTRIGLVPTMVSMIINHPEVANFDLTSLKSIRYSASPMPFEVLEKAYKVFKNCEFQSNYGMTEAATVLTHLSTKDHLIGFQSDSENI